MNFVFLYKVHLYRSKTTKRKMYGIPDNLRPSGDCKIVVTDIFDTT